jgi:hypothetical protein
MPHASALPSTCHPTCMPAHCHRPAALPRGPAHCHCLAALPRGPAHCHRPAPCPEAQRTLPLSCRPAQRASVPALVRCPLPPPAPPMPACMPAVSCASLFGGPGHSGANCSTLVLPPPSQSVALPTPSTCSVTSCQWQTLPEPTTAAVLPALQLMPCQRSRDSSVRGCVPGPRIQPSCRADTTL